MDDFVKSDERVDRRLVLRLWYQLRQEKSWHGVEDGKSIFTHRHPALDNFCLVHGIEREYGRDCWRTHARFQGAGWQVDFTLRRTKGQTEDKIECYPELWRAPENSFNHDWTMAALAV